MRILVVDDDPAIRNLLAKYLQAWGHETVLAPNGQVAWRLLQQRDIRFVITDWLMPEMDGLTLCSKIRSEDDSGSYIYVIMLTSNDARGAVVEAMAAGADDYISKGFDKAELQQRVRAGQRVLKLQTDLQEKNESLSAAYERIECDLKVASKVQQSLLPCATGEIADVSFRTYFQPCTYVAGDMYGYFQLDRDRIGFYLLDVSGHGVASALLSVAISKFLSSDSLADTSAASKSNPVRHVNPAQTVSLLNKTFQSDLDAFQYFTILYGIIDLKTDKLRMCQAGHPAPILLQQGKKASRIGAGGFPVGILPDAEYAVQEIDFAAGDRLYVYSDGVTECLDHDNQQFSHERLLHLIESYRYLPAEGILAAIDDAIRKWRDGSQFDDDLSIIAIERRA